MVKSEILKGNSRIACLGLIPQVFPAPGWSDDSQEEWHLFLGHNYFLGQTPLLSRLVSAHGTLSSHFVNV